MKPAARDHTHKFPQKYASTPGTYRKLLASKEEAPLRHLMTARRSPKGHTEGIQFVHRLIVPPKCLKGPDLQTGVPRLL